MKRLTYILYSLLVLSFPLSAQWKVVEKSHKSKPTWVGGAERNHLIVSAEAVSLEMAKEKLLVSLKEQIVGTAATHILSETTIRREQTLVGKETEYRENTSSYVKAKVAHVPFVSEVSLAKAKDFYWEKLYDKKTKDYKYEYHLRYLFTDFDAMALVNQFNEREDALKGKLSGYENRLESVGSVEEIDRTLNELKAFATEFDADDARRAQTEQLSNNYRKLYSYIVIKEESPTAKGAATIGLYLQDRPISTQQKPQLLANCATRLSSETEGNLFHISYDSTACYADDENYIDIRFRLGNRIATQRIYIR